MIQIVLDKRLKRSETMQIVDQLKHFHVQSSLKNGALFPDYQAVAVANDIDLSLMQAAYDQMVMDGYFIRNQNRYLVRRLPIVEQFVGYIDSIHGTVETLGMTPSFTTHKVEIKDHLPEEFATEATLKNRRYVRLEKVYYADQIPLIHAEQYYQLALFPDFTELDFSTMRILPYLENKHGIKLSSYHQIIDVTNPGEAINEMLNQPLNSSVFRFLTQAKDQNQVPFDFSIFHTSILYSLESINRLR